MMPNGYHGAPESLYTEPSKSGYPMTAMDTHLDMVQLIRDVISIDDRENREKVLDPNAPHRALDLNTPNSHRLLGSNDYTRTLVSGANGQPNAAYSWYPGSHANPVNHVKHEDRYSIAHKHDCVGQAPEYPTHSAPAHSAPAHSAAPLRPAGYDHSLGAPRDDRTLDMYIHPPRRTSLSPLEDAKIHSSVAVSVTPNSTHVVTATTAHITASTTTSNYTPNASRPSTLGNSTYSYSTNNSSPEHVDYYSSHSHREKGAPPVFEYNTHAHQFSPDPPDHQAQVSDRH